MFNFKLFEAGSLGRSGLSEAVLTLELLTLRPQRTERCESANVVLSIEVRAQASSERPPYLGFGSCGLDRLAERRSALPANGNNPASGTRSPRLWDADAPWGVMSRL